MKLSIIVPVYKVEQFLDKCIESILAQTFTDFELILVDDGSPDNCGKMCDVWSTKDKRIKVIHKENGGLSDARNAGIDIAQGDYIGLVDSDDYIKHDMFEVLLSNLEKYNADISMCGYVDVYADGVRKVNANRNVYEWGQEEAIHQILLGKLLSVHAVTKLYKRQLFDNVRYPVGKVSEDAYVIMDIMAQVKNAVFTPYSAYCYVHRGNSINTSKYREIDLTRIEAHEKNYRFIIDNYPQYGAIAYDRWIGSIAFVGHKMVLSNIQKSDSKYYEQVFSVLRKNIFRIYKSSYFSRKRKSSITLLILNKKVYKYVMSKYIELR